MTIRFAIIARSGVLVSGANHDFLSCILLAKRYKQRFQTLLPSSTLRVQIRYPNGQRVPTADIKSALRALSSSTVSSMVSSRLAAAALRSGAVAAECGSAVAVDVDFSQAGVVAPPDGLTGETRLIRQEATAGA